MFQNAAIWVDELTLRGGVEGSVCSPSSPLWGLVVGAAAWRATCPAIKKGVEGADWENLHYRFVEVNKEVNVRHPSGSSRAKTLFKVSDATDRDDKHYDRSYVTKIERKVRQELRSAHLMSPIFALSEALREVDTWADADSSAGGSRN